QLVSRVKQSGFNLTPKKVFDAPVLSQLAAVLAQLQQLHAVQPTEQAFPLLPIQHHFLNQQHGNINHWNQHISVALKQPMEPAVLSAALSQLVHHHGALRLRFSQDPQGQWQQVYQKLGAETLLWQSQAADDTAYQALTLELQQSLDITHGRLLGAALVSMADGSQRLLMCIHHLAIDGVSWRILIDDLWRLYQQGIAGQAPQLAPTPVSYADASQQFSTWWLQHQIDQNFWQQQGQPQPLDPAFYRDRETLKVTLSAAQTQQLLRDTVPALSVEVDALLLCCLQQSVAPKQNLAVYLESHGRDEQVFYGLDLSRTLGWMTSLFPVTLAAESNPQTQLQQTQSLLQQAKLYSGLDYGGSQFRASAASAAMASVTFNYLGQYHDSDFSHWCEPIAGEGFDQADSNTMLTPLVVNAEVSSGQLQLHWEYASSHFSAEQVTAIAKRYITQLERWNGQTSRAHGQADKRVLQPLNDAVATRTPVFCIHPVTGRAQAYQALAQALGGKRQVIGLQSRSFIEAGWFDHSFDEMADCYLASIKQQQAKGPYTLVGWSLGGALCQELVARLEAVGDEVEFVALLDCYVPGFEVAEDQWQSSVAQDKLRQHLGILLPGTSEPQLNQCLSLLNQNPPAQWPEVFAQWLTELNLDPHTRASAQDIMLSWAVEQHYRQLCDGYQLPRTAVQYVSFWAGEPAGRAQAMQNKLSKINTLNLQLTIATDHLGIVRAPQVMSHLVSALS
ncbi:condensation domain-containing protein, partial [Motilimonas pumila]